MKYNFSKKRKVQVYMLLTTLLLCVSACAFSSFDTYADSNTNLNDVYDIPTDFIENDGSGFPFLPSDVNLNGYDYNYYVNAYEQSIAQGYFCVPTSTLLSVEDYPHYAMCTNTEDMKFFVFPEDSFIVGNSTSYNGGGSFVFYINQDNVPNGLINDYKFVSTIPPTYDFWNFKQFEQFNYTGTCEVDGETYYRVYAQTTVNTVGYVLDTDLPCYYSSNLYISSLDNLEDLNPNSSSGVNQENIRNHLTLKDDSKFYISNTSFNNGTLYIYPVFDKTQLDENETLSQYYLRLTGTVSTNTTFNAGSTTYKAKINGKRLTTYFPMTNGSSNIYDFSLRSTGGNYYDIPVTSVDNGKFEMSFEELHKLFYGSGSNDNQYFLLASGYDSLYGGTDYFDSVTNFIGGLTVKGFNYNPQTSSEIDVVPTKVKYHLDLYIVKKELDNESLSDVQSYIDGDLCDGNGISGENVNTSSDEDIMNALGTDYVPNEYTSPETDTNYKDTYNGVGGSSSSSSSSPSVSPSISGGENNINIINNNTNNGSGSGSTSESSLVGSTIVTTLIKYIAGNKSSSVSYIEDIAGTNTYLQIVSNYMSFVPTEIWSLVVTCFSVCIGVVVVAFIISIVIKIIT